MVKDKRYKEFLINKISTLQNLIDSSIDKQVKEYENTIINLQGEIKSINKEYREMLKNFGRVDRGEDIELDNLEEQEEQTGEGQTGEGQTGEQQEEEKSQDTDINDEDIDNMATSLREFADNNMEDERTDFRISRKMKYEKLFGTTKPKTINGILKNYKKSKLDKKIS